MSPVCGMEPLRTFSGDGLPAWTTVVNPQVAKFLPSIQKKSPSQEGPDKIMILFFQSLSSCPSLLQSL